MKIQQLLSGFKTHITNEEHRFIENHNDNIRLSSLDEHDQWVAQNLVRKGVYAISKDSNTLVSKLDENNS